MEFWQVKCTNTDMGTQQILYSHVVLPYTEEYQGWMYVDRLKKIPDMYVWTVESVSLMATKIILLLYSSNICWVRHNSFDSGVCFLDYMYVAMVLCH